MGRFSIKEVLSFTLESEFRNRFTYSGRDVLRQISINEVVSLKYGSFDKPVKRWRVTTYSYPQYYPYLGKRSKGAKKQMSIKHSYDIVFEVDESFSVNTKNWKIRTGSLRQPIKPDQSQVQQIYTETRERWENDAKRKFKTVKEQKKYVQDLVDRQRRIAPYVSIGDYWSLVLGINADAYFRQYAVLYLEGHLWGRPLVTDVPREKHTNSSLICFYNKHEIRFIQELLNRGILNNDPVEDKIKK